MEEPSPRLAAEGGTQAEAQAAHTPQLSSIRADGGRLALHPLEVKGGFMTGRRITWAVLLAIYVVVPLVDVGGHPAVQLDFDARRFYLFGATYNAQDFWLALPLTLGFTFFLLFLTAWRGRLWCGWACPQTVFLEALYRPIERLFDGPRSRRLKRADEKLRWKDAPRLLGKHATYLLVSTLLSHVMSSIFVSVHDLKAMIADGPAAHPVAFTWTTAFTLVLYVELAWFREQFCVVLCPYGRLQSVLHDAATVTVVYDVARGEPRGKVTKGGPRLGDCVDCKKCVIACPSAIDIREGLQMECLACMQCADACDEVMDKLRRPKGLIRYASLNELAGKPRGVLRPRLFVYAGLTLAAVATLAVALAVRTPFEANILRLAGAPFVLEGESVRNQVQVHLVNKSPEPRTFELEVQGPAGMVVHLGQTRLSVKSFEGVHVPLAVVLPRSAAAAGVKVELHVKSVEDGVERALEVPFLAPRGTAAVPAS